MKVTAVRTLFVDKYLFVQVETDNGLVGTGESGAWGFLPASESAVRQCAGYLEGKDPLLIEHHFQYLYRCFHFRGAAIMGAISAIDIALWDIAAQYHQAPLHRLLGGACRDRARVYYHVFGKSTEEQVEGCLAAVARGFTAIGHLSPFHDLPRGTRYGFESKNRFIGEAAERVHRFREAVGEDVDLCIEVHRRLKPADAIALAREIQPCRPYFYEDPVPPENFDSMELVARHIDIPIATGERLESPQEFAMLLKRDAVRYVRPDLCLCGGITGARKIAAMAEAFDVMVVPHNPLSPVCTAASLQLSTAIPNFAILEYPKGEGAAPKTDIVETDYLLVDGFLTIPDTPGIGARLVPDAADRYPFNPKPFVTCTDYDGSVVDY